jgi:VWFA-related protein
MNTCESGPRSSSFQTAFALAVLAGATGLSTASAARQPASPPVFTETIDVRVVNLEVVVTDRAGNRVEGLAASEFELIVDGEIVPIELFSEVREGLAVARSGADGGDATRSVPALEPGAPVGTSFLVFVDDYFSIGRDRNRVLDHLVEQLPRLGPRDRMAVVAFDGRELELLSSWSGDLPAVAQTLRQAKARPTRGLQRITELRRDAIPPSSQNPRFGISVLSGQLSLEERYVVGKLEDQIGRVVKAAAATLRSFASPPGRRVMLLLSGGWPFDPVENLLDDPRRPITDTQVERGEGLFRDLSDTANLLGYTIYPVDVPGLEGIAADAAAEAPDPGVGGIGARSFIRESGIHRTAYFLAEETGGEALLNARREEVLERVTADLGSFYWLGFTPVRSGDDRRHEIEVRVTRPGLKVRTRRDYFDFSRQREVTLAVESALRFGAPPSPEPLLVQLGRGERSGLRTMQVPLVVGIPADAVTFLPGPGGFAAQVELRVAVLDESGATADTPVVPLTLQLPERPQPGTVLRYETSLKLRRQPHDIVVAVYDLATGAILSSALEVRP